MNIDPAEINKVYKADVAVVSDIKLALQELLPLLEKRNLPSLQIGTLPNGHYYEEPVHTDAQRIFREISSVSCLRICQTMPL